MRDIYLRANGEWVNCRDLARRYVGLNLSQHKQMSFLIGNKFNKNNHKYYCNNIVTNFFYY